MLNVLDEGILVQDELFVSSTGIEITAVLSKVQTTRV
jgi:hypothetical protein